MAMIDELAEERRKKLEAIKKAGIDPYPARVRRSFEVAHALAGFEALAASGEPVSLAGRVRSLRDQGKIIFADIEDESGKIQAVLKEDVLSDLAFWRSVLDMGDFISVTGPLFVTKRGEKSLEVREIQMASKSLLPLPDKWEGLQDEDIRFRKRYLDLVAGDELRELFRKKTVFWETFRNALKNEGFLEVETPVLENVPGGAEAEPFRTHHNALDEDFYLRISLELPLKRLLVGGFDKVFEIGRIFRNEGIDREHLQDYTQLEFYWAYHDYADVMKLTEKMYKEVILKTCGGLVTALDGKKIDWSKKWPTVDYVEEFRRANGMDPVTADRAELAKKAKELKLEFEKSAGKGRLIDLIFKKTVRPTLVEPCFLVDPPVEIEPLAKRHPVKPGVVERFQVVACGTELGKGFSELNDPDDQRARFEEQMKLRAAGDAEAQHLDEDFLEALQYGMPPAGGFGVSERLFAVLMDRPIRETVFFPLMRKKK
ncbi:MAG TPA: lysine--tRNA ligase [Candidatus Paceibacterota bacterium]|nr:lysine--tRNA ligase [Candidatus Paceibacterota bacterium]